MADQDFNIKVVTTADTTGLRQTSAEMDAVKRKAEQASAAQKQQLAAAEAKWAASPVNPKNAAAPAAGAAGDTVGLTGSAVGIGTIVTLLTSAISRWKEFNDEQDRWIDGMIKAEEKARALGESILDMQDKARDAARVGTEPLYQSFIRLQQVIIRLKTEQSLLNLPTQGEEWKKLAGNIGIAEAQLKGVTSELQQQKKLAEETAQKNAEAAASFLKGAVQTAQPNVQAALRNEVAAEKARAQGAEKEADQFQKTADQYKKQFSQSEREEYEGINRPTRLGPKAGPGESQQALDDIARNKINFERQLKGEPPLPPKPQGNEDLLAALNQLIDLWR